MLKILFGKFVDIRAKSWGQAGLVLLVAYFVAGIISVNFPSMTESLKLFFVFISGPLGVLVWAMALWRVLIETLESAP